MIVDNSEQLYENVMNALKKITNPLAWQELDPETGQPVGDKEDLFPYDAVDLNAKYADMDITTTNEDGDEIPVDVRNSTFSGRGAPDDPLFQNEYTTYSPPVSAMNAIKSTGMELQIEIVTKEILNYITEYAEVAMKPRMDKLEADYNTLLQAISDIADQIRGVTTYASTNLSWYDSSAGTSATSAGTNEYVHDFTYTNQSVISPDVLADLLDQVQVSGGGVNRYETATSVLSATNEIITINGVDYTVQIT